MVSPTICNLKVTKMLVDGRADLNLVSPAVIEKLQIPDGDLEETGTFQGVNPGRSQPKGKVTLPVTFGSDLNFRTERIVFDVSKIPLPYNGIPSAGQVHGGVTLCLQHPEEPGTCDDQHHPHR